MSAANFEAAVEYVRSLPKDGPVQLDNNAKLEFYSLYKQATEGDVQGSQPWAVQIEARAKWDAWNGRKGMSSDAAKTAYVQRLIAVTAEKGHPWNPA
ncbi:Acyl CoA binding protein [Novymonas esmeraldas]|uniref:Acyl CoA binding protein n=1 Tax=Novymonas esmeraldas TaxID=1808958 RepID=A0AAW0ELS1_9TRYP